MVKKMIFGSWLLVPLFFLTVTATAKFSPNITITSCAKRRVVIQLENAADGGLLFIQGAGPDCKENTRPEQTKHTFTFDACNLEYDSKFRVVVQEHPRYQTGQDKVIPIMCLVDTGDLYVSSVIYPEEKRNDGAVNKTVKPTVHMRVVSENNPTTSGSEFDLDENLQMVIALDDKYNSDFDIKARDCVASQIPLLKEECSEDESLFPNFAKQQQGSLLTKFPAFQPTHLIGQSEADVAFTCNISVCRGTCRQKICGAIVGWGRKKRDDDDDDDVYEKLTVGTKIKVRRANPDYTATGLMSDKKYFCGEKIMVTTVLAVSILTIVFSWLICGCVTAKLRSVKQMTSSCGSKQPSTLRRFSEKNINFARSVGRRLSNILNLPTTYDVKDRKMMDDIPEAEPSPPEKRRESVTVSDRDDVNDDVTYVSVFNQDNWKPRKRLVNSSTQTDDVIDTSVQSKDRKLKKNPFSFITSISIKSSVINKPNNKQCSGLSNPAFHSKSFDCDANERSGSTDANDVTECPDVVLYDENDVPRHRSVSAHDLNRLPRPPHTPTRVDTPATDYDWISPIKRDASFNDGSVMFDNDSKENNEFGSELPDSHIVSMPTDQDSSKPQAESHEQEHLDRSDANDVICGDVTDTTKGRVTPVEDYYDAIDIVPKGNKLARQYSTHV